MATPLEQEANRTAQSPLTAPVDFYREAVLQLLSEQNAKEPQQWQVEQQLVIDQKHDHYLLLRLGWHLDETKREYRVVFHLDIINGKIWIQQNQTELLIEKVLVERGVPPEDIVLGMLPTFSRQHSGYGVG